MVSQAESLKSCTIITYHTLKDALTNDGSLRDPSLVPAGGSAGFCLEDLRYVVLQLHSFMADEGLSPKGGSKASDPEWGPRAQERQGNYFTRDNWSQASRGFWDPPF